MSPMRIVVELGSLEAIMSFAETGPGAALFRIGSGTPWTGR